MKTRILLVEDDPRYAARLQKNIVLAGYDVSHAENGEVALAALADYPADLIISDIRMPKMDGLELLKAIRSGKSSDDSDIPFIALTSIDLVQVAVDAMKLGANDYITKDADRDEVLIRIEKAVKSSRVHHENKRLREQVRIEKGATLIAESPSMKAIVEEIDRVADSGAGVLIVGETGVGKEIIARALHDRSPRSGEAFVDVNCAALPSDNLFQSEVFGHEKGAFTGATERKRGKMELANGGTLFLDEIGDMPLESQGKILRALETETFERLGGNQKIKVDLTVVAATNKDLSLAVEQNEFRQDLLYRIDIIRLDIPPLRERKEEILPLARFFLDAYASKYRRPVPECDAESLRVLESSPWPGNVRELKNLMERIIIRHRDCTIITASLLAAEGYGTDQPRTTTAPTSLEDIEKQAIIDALEATNWVQSEAAKRLQISADRIHARIKKYGLSHPTWRTHKS